MGQITQQTVSEHWRKYRS